MVVAVVSFAQALPFGWTVFSETSCTSGINLRILEEKDTFTGCHIWPKKQIQIYLEYQNEKNNLRYRARNKMTRSSLEQESVGTETISANGQSQQGPTGQYTFGWKRLQMHLEQCESVRVQGGCLRRLHHHPHYPPSTWYYHQEQQQQQSSSSTSNPSDVSIKSPHLLSRIGIFCREQSERENILQEIKPQTV